MRLQSALTVATLATLSSLALSKDLDVHVRAKPQEAVVLLLSPARGPGLSIPGITGVLRLDAARLLVVPGMPANRGGFSITRIPGAGGLPPELLSCQALVVGARGVLLTRVFQPLVDQRVDAVERGLVLGTAGPSGPYLFGLTRAQILATAAKYTKAPIDEEEILATLSRPFRRAFSPRLADAVGLENMLRLVHARWDGMLRGTALTQLSQTIGRMQSDMREQAFAAKYPNGVPEDDEHWDYAVEARGPQIASCSQEIKVTSGDYRLKVETDIDPGVQAYAWGDGTSTSYHRDWLGIWWKHKADKITISVNVHTDMQDNTFSDTNYDEKTAFDAGAAWYYTKSSSRVDTKGTATWGNLTLQGSVCEEL